MTTDHKKRADEEDGQESGIEPLSTDDVCYTGERVEPYVIPRMNVSIHGCLFLIAGLLEAALQEATNSSRKQQSTHPMRSICLLSEGEEQTNGVDITPNGMKMTDL